MMNISTTDIQLFNRMEVELGKTKGLVRSVIDGIKVDINDMVSLILYVQNTGEEELYPAKNDMLNCLDDLFDEEEEEKVQTQTLSNTTSLNILLNVNMRCNIKGKRKLVKKELNKVLLRHKLSFENWYINKFEEEKFSLWKSLTSALHNAKMFFRNKPEILNNVLILLTNLINLNSNDEEMKVGDNLVK